VGKPFAWLICGNTGAVALVGGVVLLAILVGLIWGFVEAATGSDGSGGSTHSRCDPSYRGACLDPEAADYYCAGGGGNTPKYTGAVEVVGDDQYGLDRDGNGYGCE
jgi:hypothetical protein